MTPAEIEATVQAFLALKPEAQKGIAALIHLFHKPKVVVPLPELVSPEQTPGHLPSLDVLGGVDSEAEALGLAGGKQAAEENPKIMKFLSTRFLNGCNRGAVGSPNSPRTSLKTWRGPAFFGTAMRC